MVPSDYRLDQVTARLIERLEGARRTFGSDRQGAEASFRTIAREHVDGAIAEFEALALEDPGPHGGFLSTEVLDTALPRYLRLAMDMNAAEARGYGFGWLAQPIGRLALTFVAALGAIVLVRLAGTPFGWSLLLLDLSLPAWPTFAALAVNRRYRIEVEAVVADMARIQDHARAYLTDAELDAGHDRSIREPATALEPTDDDRGDP